MTNRGPNLFLLTTFAVKLERELLHSDVDLIGHISILDLKHVVASGTKATIKDLIYILTYKRLPAYIPQVIVPHAYSLSVFVRMVMANLFSNASFILDNFR